MYLAFPYHYYLLRLLLLLTLHQASACSGITMATLGQEFSAIITGNLPSATNAAPPAVNCPQLYAAQDSGNLTAASLEPIQSSLQSGSPSTVTCRWSVSGIAGVSTDSGSTLITSGSVISHPGNQTHIPVPPPHPSNGTIIQNPGVSSGAAAGLGVGLAILGILFGAAVAWWCFGRRNRKSEPTTTSKASVGASILQPRPSDRGGGPLSSLGGPPEPSLDLYLLDGTGDSEITSEMTALGYLIKDHVENNYHLGPIRHNALAIKGTLGGLGLDGQTQSQIETLSLDPRTRHAAIRRLLSRVIFSALDLHQVEGISLLPPSIVAFAKALPPSKKSENARSPTARAFDTWRRLSVFLLHENSQERTPLAPPSSIVVQIKYLQHALDKFLGHFVHEDRRARTDQAQNMESVIRECTALGYLVFSHPCKWRYLFEVESKSSSGVMVVMPGLERLISRKGEPFDTPQVVAKPITVNI